MHIRPLGKIAEESQKYTSTIELRHLETEVKVNAKSLIEMLSLGAVHNAPLEIYADGPDAEETIRNLAFLL